MFINCTFNGVKQITQFISMFVTKKYLKRCGIAVHSKREKKTNDMDQVWNPLVGTERMNENRNKKK